MVVSLMDWDYSHQIFYINEKNQINLVTPNKFSDWEGPPVFHFKILEPHLICGIQVEGRQIFNQTNGYAYFPAFPFNPLERFLMDPRNVKFQIPLNQFRQENSLFVYHHNACLSQLTDAKNLGDLFEKIERTYYSDASYRGLP